MTQISPNDIATQWPAIQSRLAQGEEILVTDHGRPVARIVPPAGDVARPGAAVAQDAWLRDFNDWMRDVDARADRYPAGFALDDSREGIYDGRGA
jgi:antitoxin (DNA-binding transcriptional repressor) of toxin-antitoxin stability system